MTFREDIRNLIEKTNSDTCPIEKHRNKMLREIQGYFDINGFPKALTLHKLSLVPFIFQEANYDGINYGHQHSELEHLSMEFEIDCMFHNNGSLRIQLDEADFLSYMRFSQEAIEKVFEKR